MPRLSAFADKLGLILKGEDQEFCGLNTLEAAGPDEVSFLANVKYRHFLPQTRACAVIISPEFAGEVKTALISENPYFDFARAAAMFVRKPSACSGISDLAVIDPTAKLGENVTVHPHAHIGAGTEIGDGCVIFPGAYVGDDCRIGNGCTIYPNAVVLAGVEIGASCVLNSGCVIGTDGFGFTRVGGAMQKIPQIGTVRLDSGVDVGANTCVDRATLGATRIGMDSKLDNLVQIGHNVSLGEQCLIISQVGISGSTKVGDRVTMAGQAGIAGHLHIGNDVTIGPQAGVPKDIPAGVTGTGSPFVEGGQAMRSISIMYKLPELYQRLRQLEKEVAALKAGACSEPGSNPDSGDSKEEL